MIPATLALVLLFQGAPIAPDQAPAVPSTPVAPSAPESPVTPRGPIDVRVSQESNLWHDLSMSLMGLVGALIGASLGARATLLATREANKVSAEQADLDRAATLDGAEIARTMALRKELLLDASAEIARLLTKMANLPSGPDGTTESFAAASAKLGLVAGPELDAALSHLTVVIFRVNRDLSFKVLPLHMAESAVEYHSRAMAAESSEQERILNELKRGRESKTIDAGHREQLNASFADARERELNHQRSHDASVRRNLELMVDYMRTVLENSEQIDRANLAFQIAARRELGSPTDADLERRFWETGRLTREIALDGIRQLEAQAEKLGGDEDRVEDPR